MTPQPLKLSLSTETPFIAFKWHESGDWNKWNQIEEWPHADETKKIFFIYKIKSEFLWIQNVASHLINFGFYFDVVCRKQVEIKKNSFLLVVTTTWSHVRFRKSGKQRLQFNCVNKRRIFISSPFSHATFVRFFYCLFKSTLTHLDKYLNADRIMSIFHSR